VLPAGTTIGWPGLAPGRRVRLKQGAPSEPFEYDERKDVRVNIDYYVEVDHHF
jgi:hypothetical protein